MSKSIAQYIEEKRTKEYEGEVELGTIMMVDSHPYIYLPSGKRPYFREKDSTIIIM